MTDTELIVKLCRENVTLRDSVNYWSERCLKAEEHSIPVVPQTLDETLTVLNKMEVKK